MNAVGAQCVSCGRSYSLGVVSRCCQCNGPLDIQYALDRVKPDLFASVGEWREDGIWAYRELLPVSSSTYVSLGEGRTPVLRLPRLEQQIGIDCLYLKDETRQPTGSFKDRPLSVAISKAREFQLDTIVTASSGNAAAAASAYSARAGLRCVVIVPESTSQGKLLQMMAAGAKVVRIAGSVSDCIALVKEAVREYSWYDVTTTFANPYSVEGNKTVAYELMKDIGESPDWIIVPVGAGPLLVGIWKGFCELAAMGVATSIPRMVAAQAAGCAPIADAFVRGEDRVKPWTSPNSVATGICDPLVGYPEDGTYTLRIVRETRGQAVGVDDEALLDGARCLAEVEGVYVEPTVGAAIAALTQLVKRGIITTGQKVVLVSTGHGLKQPRSASDTLAEKIEPTIQALDAWRRRNL